MIDTSYRPRNLSLCITVTGLVLLIVGLFIRSNGNCSTMTPACAAAIVTCLMGLLAAGRTIFERRQRQEERDAAEYHRQHGNAELFGDADEAVKLATRSNRQYMKYFVPSATILMGITLGAFVVNRWFIYRPLTASPVAINPLPMAILAFCCCIATLIAGSFFIGVSRERGCRWIRPAAAWLFLSGILSLAGSAVLFCEYAKKFTVTADITMARIGVVILGILAIELILAFVIEFYRPRMPNEEERPLPESRLLSFFTEPGSVARNVADSLDYQFGFRVSDAWFYRFLERTIVPLLMVMVAAFWLMTCIVTVEPDQTALRERFGRAVNQEPFGAGVYFKLPYPFESIYRFSSTRVQQLTIEGHDDKEEEIEQPGEDDGHGHDHGHGHNEKEKEDDHGNESTILWNIEKKHGDEAGFLVGAKSFERVSLDVQLGSGNSQGQQGVGLLAAHIPLFFKVNNLYKYSYNNRDAALILKNIGQRELLEYFIQTDWNHLLGAGRGEAAEILRERIQRAADEFDLGVEVVFIALTGLHPPVGVGAAFETITQATVDKQRLIQDAQIEANQIRSASETSVRLIENQAKSYRDTQISQAEADSGRFAGQMLCYQAAPQQYLLNSYYDVLEGEGAKARRFVLTGNAKDEVLWLNLERKAKSGLLDLSLGQ